jgi:hypothetical protein
VLSKLLALLFGDRCHPSLFGHTLNRTNPFTMWHRVFGVHERVEFLNLQGCDGCKEKGLFPLDIEEDTQRPLDVFLGMR